jgi:hypothetical protein
MYSLRNKHALHITGKRSAKYKPVKVEIISMQHSGANTGASAGADAYRKRPAKKRVLHSFWRYLFYAHECAGFDEQPQQSYGNARPHKQQSLTGQARPNALNGHLSPHQSSGTGAVSPSSTTPANKHLAAPEIAAIYDPNTDGYFYTQGGSRGWRLRAFEETIAQLPPHCGAPTALMVAAGCSASVRTCLPPPLNPLLVAQLPPAHQSGAAFMQRTAQYTTRYMCPFCCKLYKYARPHLVNVP